MIGEKVRNPIFPKNRISLNLRIRFTYHLSVSERVSVVLASDRQWWKVAAVKLMVRNPIFPKNRISLNFLGPARRRRRLTFLGPVRRRRLFTFLGPVCRRRRLAGAILND
jgi:hypothetical protein